MTKEISLKREESYIRHIALAVTADDRSAPFRTFFDNWFAYYAQGAFLNSNGAPHWFNKADPVKSANALKSMHYVSDKAYRILVGEAPPEGLIKDHTVPVSVLRDHLLSHQISDEVEIRKTLIKYYKLGVLTADDDRELNARGLRSKIGTTALHEDYDPQERYDLARLVTHLCADKFQSRSLKG